MHPSTATVLRTRRVARVERYGQSAGQAAAHLAALGTPCPDRDQIPPPCKLDPHKYDLDLYYERYQERYDQVMESRMYWARAMNGEVESQASEERGGELRALV